MENFIQEAWNYHDSKTAQLAQELENRSNEVKEKQIVQFLNLSNHTIGEHLGEWGRARKVAENVAENEKAFMKVPRAAAFLSVARYMDGDILAAQQAETLGIQASGDDAIATTLDTKVLIAKALIFSKRFEEGSRMYNSVIELATSKDAPESSERSLAVASNNIAGELLAMQDRSQLQSDLMKMSAQESLRFWTKCGTWENEERGLYLLVLVENELENYDDALYYAYQALTVVSENGGEVVDEAFIRLAAANSHRQLNSAERYKAELEKADELAASWDDESLHAWYQDERGKVAV